MTIKQQGDYLYVVKKRQGKQDCKPIAKAIAEHRQALDAARLRLAEATAGYETLRDQLRVTLAAGDWPKARALQGAVDQAKQAERDADAEIAKLTDQLAEFEAAVLGQRVRQREQRVLADMQAMLDRHPIPEPPEAA